jgi:hypothetical protein
MVAAGLTPDVRNFTATKDACSKGGQYQMPVDLLHEMIAAGVVADLMRAQSAARLSAPMPCCRR